MPTPTSRLVAETMEDRILHSADIAPLALAADAATTLLSAPAQTTAAPDATDTQSEIVFLDSSLPDAATLITDLHAQQSAGRPIEIVTFDSGDDGLAVISATLAGRQDVAAVHVLAHGSDGILELGSTWLDAQTLLQRADEIAAWRNALTGEADLLLYGCDLAATEIGQELVRDLAALTGADVAASTDLTGAAVQGGDWLLEYQTGVIESALALSAAEQADWSGVLNTAPAVTLPASVAVTQDSSLTFNGANTITLADAEAGAGPVRLDLTATQGLLDLRPIVGSEFQVNLTTSNRQEAPQIAVAADGHYVAVWQSNNQDGSKLGVYARVYNADGTARTGEIAVNTTTNDNQSMPSVAIDASGRFVVAWQSFDTNKLTWDVYARSFDADGSTLSGQKRITSDNDDQMAPVVAMDGSGNVVIVYQSKGQDSGTTQGIYARTANATLSTINAEFRVNTTTANDQMAPAVARNGSGFVIAWQSAGQDGSGTGIYAQRFTASGGTVGGEFRINATTAGDQSTPSLAMNAAGELAVAWQSAAQDGSGWAVVARRFDATGNALTGDVLINTTSAGDQNDPSVVLTSDGRFAVAWTSVGQDNADGKAGVYMRSFAADGSALTGETIVNTTTAEEQSAASLGIAGDDRMVAVWQSDKQDGNNYGVFGQRLLQPGALRFASGDGIADTSLAVTGTIADLNTALQTLRYTPNAGYWGPASLTLTVDDLASGGGPAMSTTTTLSIDVQKINVGPSTTVPGAQATIEDTPIVFSAATSNAITVADPDADPDPVQVSLSVANGTLRLASTTGLTIVGGADGSGSMVVQGRIVNLNAALDGLSYRPNADYTGADTLSVVTDDLGHNTVGGPYTATGTVALSVSAVNDAPVNLLPASAATIENTTLVLSTANGNALRIADVDAGTGNLEVSLTSTYGTLKLARTTNLSFTVGDGKGGEDRLVFRGKLVDINAALDGMSFEPLSGYAGPAYLEVSTNDLGNSGAGGALADRDVLEITVAPNANNATPVIAVPPNQTTTEETPITLSTAGGNAITVLDDAGGGLLQVTLTVTNGTLTLGTSTGGEFQVNTAVANDQQAPRVAMTADGGHVVVWQSNNQDGSGQGIYLQRYSDDGLALGVEQRVNTTTAGSQSEPAIAIADDGSFVVVWTSDGQDGSGKGVYAQRFAADGTPVGAEFRVNVTTANHQQDPVIATDAAGNFVVVWESKDQDGDGWGIYGRRFAADGTPLSAEFRINTTTAKDQTAPVVAMADAGTFVVAWQSLRQADNHWGIVAQRFDASGAAAGSEFAVATVTYKDQTAPAIAADPAGNFVIAWQSQDIDYNDGKFGIYAQRFLADGLANGSQFLVNSRTPGDQTAPAVAIDSNGSFVIAWQSKGQELKDDPAGVYAQRYDSTGAAQGGEFRVNTTIADAQTVPALAISDKGQLLVVWTSDKQDGSGLGVYGQRYIDARSLGFSVGDGTDDATMTFTGTLDQINDVLDGLIYTPAPDFDGKATLTVSVDDLGHSGSGGAKVSTKNFQITVAGVNDPPVISVPAARTLTEGNPVVFSVAGGSAITVADPDADTKKLLVTLTAPTGTLTLATLGGLQFTVGDGTADATMTFTGTLVQINAALDGLQLNLPLHFTGDALVQVYVSDQGNIGSGGVRTDQAAALVTLVPDSVNTAPVVSMPAPQRTAVDTSLTLASVQQNGIGVVDDAGSNPVRVTVGVTNGTVTLDSRIGAQANANLSTLGDQTEARIAMLPDGSHIVVWTSDSVDGSGSAVVAQRFDASGARIGAEWRVNSTTANNQYAPAVAADPTGGFLIAWVSDNQDGSGRGVYFQRYDTTGQALGTETRANTTISGDQTAPAVAITSSGAFVVVWQSDDANGDGVFAQLFDANGEPVGAEMQVNVAAAGDQQLPAVAMDGAGNFVVVWQGRDSDAEGILARRFDAAGNALGSEFVVNATVTDKQLTPALAMNAAGNWIVAWQSPDANNSGIFGQRFDAAGAAVGSQFSINTTTTGNQIAPSVAINDSGAFAVVWQSADANGQGVFAQAFAADGSAAGREQLVNTTTSGNQVAPSVGIAADGTYRIVWTGDNQDGDGKGIGVQSMLRAGVLAFSTGDGVNDSSMTFTARLADVNAVLDGLQFTPSAGFVGIANVAVTVDDLGASGSGGAQVGSGDVDIVVGNAPLIDLDANDSAGLGGADFRVNFPPGLGPVPVADTDATVTDPNSGNLQSLTVRITNPLDGAAETLTANTGGTSIIASYNSATATLTLSGSNSVANYQKVLRTVTYNNISAAPSTSVRSITFVAFDGSGNSNVGTAFVGFTVPNTAPTATNDFYSVAENQVLSIPPNGVLSNDADAEFDALTATLVSPAAHGALTLAADGSFTYTPAAGFSGLDSFSYVANDGQAISGLATVTISVGAVHAAPSGADNTLTMAEDGTLAFASADFGFSDAADSPADTFLGVQIAALPTAGTLSLYGAAVSPGAFIQVDDIDNGGLTFTPAANANGSGYASFTFQVRDDGGTANGGVDLDPTPRTMTIDVTAVADPPGVAALLADQLAIEDAAFAFTVPAGAFIDPDVGDTLSYSATLDSGAPLPSWLAFDAATRMFSGTPSDADGGTVVVRVTATDPGGATAEDEFALTVAGVNDAPAGASATVATPEDTPYVFTTTDFGFSDAGDAPANALLAVRIGTLPALGSLTLDGVTVTAGQSISAADIAAGRLAFSPVANASGTAYASFTFQVQDDGGTANGGTDLDPTPRTLTIDVTPVNDAPVNTVPGPQSTPRNEALIFSMANGNAISVNDVDAGANPIEVTLTATNGRLTLAGTAGLAFSVGNGFTDSTMTFSGTIADINAALNGLRFDPSNDFSGSANVVLTSKDLGNTGSGAPQTATDSVSIAVGAGNTAPVLGGTNPMTPIAEDAVSNGGTLVSALIAGQVTDPDTAAVSGVAVTGVDNSNGSWQYSTDGGATWLAFGTPSTSSARLLAGDSNTYVRFVPSANWNGTVGNGITFLAWDRTTGTAGGTADTTPVTETVRDDFSAVSYSNNDGSAIWSTPWVAFDNLGGGPASGDVSVSGGALIIKAAWSFEGAYRAADLSGASSATLSFSYDNQLALAGEEISLVAWSGTASYTTLARFSPGSLAGTGTLSVDISGFIASDSWIGFDVTGTNSPAMARSLAIDNVQISYTKPRSGGSTAFSTAAASASIEVQPVNDAPVGAANTVTTLEDAGYTFTLANFTLADPNDSPANALATVKITTLPGSGTLTLGGAAVSAGQFVSATDIAAGGLVYTPAANANGMGYASFTFQVRDDGGAANGGVDLDPTPRTMTIDVTAVNDAPLASGMASLSPVAEDSTNPSGATIGSLFAANFSDAADAATPATAQFAGVAVRGQSVIAAQGRWQYSIDGGANWSNFGFISDTNAVSLGLADHVRFLPGPDYNGTPTGLSARLIDNSMTVVGGATINASSFDGASAFSGNVVSLSTLITAVNDAPAGTSVTVVTPEDSAYTFAIADFGFTDPSDAPANALADAKITTLPGNGSLTLAGAAVTAGQFVSAADIAAGQLVFTPAPNANGSGYASFTFQVRDDGGTASGGVDLDATARTMTIDVAPVNDVPAIATSGGALAYAENAAPSPVDAALTVSDIDSANLTGASVAITANYASGQDVLAFTDQLGITGSWDSATGVLTLTGSASVTDYQTALRSITYANTSDAPNAAVRTVSFSVSDGAASSPAATRDIAVTPLNDAPLGADMTVATAEGTPYVFGAADFAFSDPGDAPANALAAVEVATLPGAGTLANDGDVLTAGSFVSAADIAAGKLVFTPAANASGTGYASFTFRVQDDGGTANGGVDLDPTARTMTIDVAPVNDAPVIATSASMLVYTEPAVAIPLDTALALSDIDSPSLAGATVAISGNYASGEDVLGFTDQFGITGSWDAASGVLTLAGSASVADYQAALRSVSYVNSSGAPSTAMRTVSFAVSDGAATSAAATRDIAIKLVNHAPAGTDTTVTTLEDSAYTFAIADFGFADPNDAATDALDAVLITALPANGTLSLAGATVSAGEFVSATDIAAGALVFTPAANASGSAYASFTFQVRDDGGTANGGIDLDPTPRTMTIDVTPVNDAPTLARPLADQAATTDQAFRYTVPQDSFTDVDAGGALAYTATLADGTPLPVWLTFDAATRTFSGTPDAANTGLVRVRVTAMDASGAAMADEFALRVSEPVLAVAPETPISNAPTTTPPPAPTTVAVTPAPTVVPAALVVAEAPRTPAPIFETAGTTPTPDIGAAGAPLPITVDVQSRPRAESWVEALFSTPLLPEFTDLSTNALAQWLRSDDMVRRFDEIEQQLRQAAAERQASLTSNIALTSGLSIGYVVWLVRGGVLMSSLLSSLPAWQMIDPMPVLAAAGARRRRRDEVDGRDRDRDVERLFDGKPTTAAAAPTAPATPAAKTEPARRSAASDVSTAGGQPPVPPEERG